ISRRELATYNQRPDNGRLPHFPDCAWIHVPTLLFSLRSTPTRHSNNIHTTTGKRTNRLQHGHLRTISRITARTLTTRFFLTPARVPAGLHLLTNRSTPPTHLTLN